MSPEDIVKRMAAITHEFGDTWKTFVLSALCPHATTLRDSSTSTNRLPPTPIHPRPRSELLTKQAASLGLTVDRTLDDAHPTERRSTDQVANGGAVGDGGAVEIADLKDKATLEFEMPEEPQEVQNKRGSEHASSGWTAE